MNNAEIKMRFISLPVNGLVVLYLKFRVTDAIPFAEVEAEAKRRKIR
jgi:hypothetical protein